MVRVDGGMRHAWARYQADSSSPWGACRQQRPGVVCVAPAGVMDPQAGMLIGASLNSAPSRSFPRRILSGILWAAGAVFVMAILIAIPYGAH